MVVPRDADEERVREAARLFVERGLQKGASVFEPGRTVWSRSATNELLALCESSSSLHGGTSLEKLAFPLSGASDDARLLLAELVTWQLLPVYKGTLSGQAKQQRIETILNSMDHPVQIPTSILRALKTGIFNPGKAITDDLFPGTLWLIHVLDAWLKLSDSERLVRANPWSWKEFVFGVPGPTYASQRNSLLYLV
ncbi:hypothetical protein JF66_20650, partial [Cryobacterium sp. MLB-32]